MVTVDSHQPLPSIGGPSTDNLKQLVKQQRTETKEKIVDSAPAATDVSLLCSLLYASSQIEQGMDTAPTYESVASAGTPAFTSAHVMQFAGANKAAARPGGEANKDVNKVFPRRKAGQDSRTNRQPVVLSEEVLRGLFCLPLQEACSKLGICATALKKACRKLGIQKWPYRTSKASPTATPTMHFPAMGEVMLFQETAQWFRSKETAHADANASADKSALISVSSLIN